MIHTLSSFVAASCMPFMTVDLNDSTEPLESTKAMVEYCKRGLLSLTILLILFLPVGNSFRIKTIGISGL